MNTYRCLLSLLLFLGSIVNARRLYLGSGRYLIEDPTSRLSQVVNETNLEFVGDNIGEQTTPIYWHVPKAGGTTMLNMTSRCLGLATAAQVGTTQGHGSEATLRVIHFADGSEFINVDTTSLDGLNRANEMGFIGSNLVDVIFTSLIAQASHALFDANHKGSVFGLFRHPIDRAVSLFYYLQMATWEPTYKAEFQNMTLNEFISSPYVESNWMVRMISGRYNEPLRDEDLENAKRLVSEKFWVGLLGNMEESLNRFGSLYGWDELPDWKICVSQATKHPANAHGHPKVSVGGEEYQMLEEINYLDVELYDHIVHVFDLQGDLFFSETIQT